MKNPIVIVSGIIGIVLLVLAFLYFTTQANNLPSFMPGYDPNVTTVHIKHGIGSALLGLAAFAFAWFQSKPKAISAPKQEQS